MSEIFEINDEELQVKIGGEVHTFRAPTSLEEESLQDTFKNYDMDSSDKKVTVLYKEFLSGLGLPREKLDQLSSKSLLALFSHSVGSKKN